MNKTLQHKLVKNHPSQMGGMKRSFSPYLCRMVLEHAQNFPSTVCEFAPPVIDWRENSDILYLLQISGLVGYEQEIRVFF